MASFEELCSEVELKCLAQRLSSAGIDDAALLQMRGEVNARHLTPDMRFYTTPMRDCVASVDSSTAGRTSIQLVMLPVENAGPSVLGFPQLAAAFVEQCLGGVTAAFRTEPSSSGTIAVDAVQMGHGYEVAWQEIFGGVGCRYKLDECVSYRLHDDYAVGSCGSSETNAQMLEESGLSLDSLSEGDTALVKRQWGYDMEGKDRLIRKMIMRLPSACVRRKDTGEPVAWCLQYTSGAIAALHVLEAFRRRGLGTMLLREQARQIILARNRGADESIATMLPVFAFVFAKNSASRALFDAQPQMWQRGKDVAWLMFTKGSPS